MTTAFVSAIGAAAEALQLLADVALLCLGITAARTVIDALDRITRAIAWVTGLLALLLQLLLALSADLAPVIGRHLGRWAGRAVRWGRVTRSAFDRHAAPLLGALAVTADYAARRHIADQLGDNYPAVRRPISPAILLSICIAPVEPAAPTAEAPALEGLGIRALKAIARERRLPRYGALNKAQLLAALAAA